MLFKQWECSECGSVQVYGVPCSCKLPNVRELLNNEFRMIISHRLLGYDCDIEVEDWEGMLDSLVDAACEKLDIL